MPRLRNTRTGVVVGVSDERAATLGAEWVPVDAPANSLEAHKPKSQAKREAAQAAHPSSE